MGVLGTLLVMACDSADVDASGQCTHAQWVAQPTLIPEFDAAAGVAVGMAILLVWATAYGFKAMRRAGD